MGLLLILVASACNPDDTEEREYTFETGSAGFIGGFTDLPENYDPELYELEFAHASLPEEVGPGSGLMLKGKNCSDDLFMYIAKQLGDLKPNTKYKVIIEIDLATDAPAGAVGIGGPPGEAVFVKVGASPIKPQGVAVDSHLYLNLDKGTQNGGGKDAVQIGNAAKVVNDEFYVYETKTMNNSDSPLIVQTDAEGKFWIFAGTDSGFEGITVLYYEAVRVKLQKAR